MSAAPESHIANIYIEDQNSSNLPDYIKKEQKAALQDLINYSSFQPLNDNTAPYEIKLSIEENRLVIRMSNSQQVELTTLVLSLKPYKRLIQDYFLMLDSYEKARLNATSDKLEAIDMGRRGLHNEGAEMFQTRLKDKIEMDFETARKFFTLICVLHKTQMRLVG